MAVRGWDMERASNDNLDRLAADPRRVGLCATCRHVRVIRSDRGSAFYMCQLSATDPRFAKYPTLPVAVCYGYERISDDSAE
jgi:hypothetical protein